MSFCSANVIAARWGVSARTVRNYCASGRIPGAFLTGKTWNIPDDAQKPSRAVRSDKKPSGLLEVLKGEQSSGVAGGIYHKVQIELTYNTNHIEGSQLSHDQTRFIFETNTIGAGGSEVRVDDVVETANHFRCIDLVLDQASRKPTESFIKLLHLTLKNGTSDSRKPWFAVGDYKRVPNEVGGRPTAQPEEVAMRMRDLLTAYNMLESPALDDLLDFHVQFERIHPFQDGNGRVGRLLLFKECLRWNIVPFIIDEQLKAFYYRGLSEWGQERGYLRDTCLTAQDSFKAWLDYFRIPYA